MTKLISAVLFAVCAALAAPAMAASHAGGAPMKSDAASAPAKKAKKAKAGMKKKDYMTKKEDTKK
jgi:hypothetical protein